MQRLSAQCLAVLFKGMLKIVAYEIVVNNGAVGTYEHISRNSVPSFGKGQLLRYAEFSRSEKKTVLIACGYGGSPEKPANIAIAPIGDYLNRRESIECINTNKIDLQKYVFNIIWNRYNHLNLSQF